MTLTEYLDAYDRALAKLELVGVRVGGANRLAAYRRRFVKARDDEAVGVEDHQGTAEFINALVESAEIITLADVDAAWLDDAVVRRKFHSIKDGPELMQPTGLDPARDHAFEVITALALRSQGRFGSFLREGGDLTMAPFPTPVECKRISSLGSLEGRLRAARDQLDAGVRLGRTPGVICLDLTRPIRIERGLTTITGPAQAAVSDPDALLTAFLDRYLLRAKFATLLERPAIIGVMARFMGGWMEGAREHVRSRAVWQACSVHDASSELDQRFAEDAVGFGPGALVEGTIDEMRAARREVFSRTR